MNMPEDKKAQNDNETTEPDNQPKQSNLESRKLDEITQDKEEYLNRLKYLQAEFDNYRKYVEKTQKHAQDTANEALVIDLLPVLDDFEAALENIKDIKTKEGIQILFSNFLKTLEKHGLREIRIGENFDPYYHEAVLQEESEKSEGIILQELQKGYMLNSKVIRHTKVKVSR